MQTGTHVIAAADPCPTTSAESLAAFTATHTYGRRTTGNTCPTWRVPRAAPLIGAGFPQILRTTRPDHGYLGTRSALAPQLTPNSPSPGPVRPVQVPVHGVR